MKTRSPGLDFAVTGLAAASLGWLAAGWLGAGDRPAPGGREAATRQALPDLGRPDHWERGYAEVAAHGDPASQMAAAIAMANRIPPDAFAQFLENLRRLPAHAAQGLAKATVLRRWVATEPEAALRWCLLNSESEGARDVVEEWACREPSRAADILQALPESERDAARLRVFAGLSRADREAAMTWLAAMTDSGEKDASSRSMHRWAGALLFAPPIDSLRDLARQDPAWLLDRCDGMPEHIRQVARAAVAQSISEQSTQAALDWINTQPDHVSLLGGLVHRPHDEAAVFAAIAALSPEEQKALPTHAFSRWGAADPGALVDSLDTHGASLADAVKRQFQASLPQKLAASDSPGALADRLLANPALRDGFGIDSFALAWATKDPAAASRWVATLANPDDRRVAQTAMQFAGADGSDAPPASLRDHFASMAAESAINEPSHLLRLSPDDRLAVLENEFARRSEDQGRADSGSALGAMAQQFPAEAAGWLQRTVTPDNSRLFLPALTLVASRWAAEEPAAAARWAAALPEGDARAWAAANVAARWARFDEASARRWVASLPAADQAIAAQGLPERE